VFADRQFSRVRIQLLEFIRDLTDKFLRNPSARSRKLSISWRSLKRRYSGMRKGSDQRVFFFPLSPPTIFDPASNRPGPRILDKATPLRAQIENGKSIFDRRQKALTASEKVL